VVEFAHGLILLAVREGASDIHIEPGEEKGSYSIPGRRRAARKKQGGRNRCCRLWCHASKFWPIWISPKRGAPKTAVSTSSSVTAPSISAFRAFPPSTARRSWRYPWAQTQSRDVPELTELAMSKSVARDRKAHYGHALRDLLRHRADRIGQGPPPCFPCSSISISRNQHHHHRRPGGIPVVGINQVQVNSAVELDFASALRAYLARTRT